MMDLYLNLAKLERTSSGDVPYRTYSVPDEWRESDERQADFWRQAAAAPSKLGFELEMAMARAMIGALLVQNKYVDGTAGHFKSWPSRDRHQLWATAWLALRFVAGRSYTTHEVDQLISCHLSAACSSDALVVAIHAELVRRGFLVPAPAADAPGAAAATVGGGAAAPEGGALALSREQVSFLLDGDKLFVLRTAVAARRPWWALPLAAQLVAAPRPETPPDGRVSATAFRVVLLAPLASTTDAAAPPPALPSTAFVPAGGGAPLACRAADVDAVEAEHRFACLECVFESPTSCSEVRVAASSTGAAAAAAGSIETRLPPFRVEFFDGAACCWRLLQCQPLPTGEEVLNSVSRPDCFWLLLSAFECPRPRKSSAR